MPHYLLRFLLPLLALAAPPGKELSERLSRDENYVNLSADPGVQLDFRYATENNFLHRNVYGEFRQCFLHREAAEKFRRALALLEKERPGWKFVLFDCLRPRAIQRAMWEIVGHTPEKKYVANPAKGSLHNYGFAVDLSLANATGEPLDMGTPFDYFGELAEPRREVEMVQAGKLSAAQAANRKVLRSLMKRAGFRQLAVEWWHYDALPRAEVEKNYPVVE